MNQISARAAAWSISVFLIAGMVGCAPLHHQNAKDFDPHDHDAAEETSASAVTPYFTEPRKADETEKFDAALPELPKVKIDPEVLRKAQERKKPLQGLFRTTLESVKTDGKIEFRIALRNISGHELNVRYGSGQRYDIWVYNEKNEEVYQWSYNKAFTMALIETAIKKDGQFTFSEEWLLDDAEGNRVPPGQYTVKVKVLIGLQSGSVRPDELTAESAIIIE